MEFVVYEVWTTSRVITARNLDEALEVSQPKPRDDLDLCNWHVVEIGIREKPLGISRQDVARGLDE